MRLRSKPGYPAGDMRRRLLQRGEIAIERSFAIEGCCPQDVLKWPKKLPAEAGTSGHPAGRIPLLRINFALKFPDLILERWD